MNGGVVSFLCLATILHAQLPQSDPAVLLHADARQRASWAAEWLNSGDPLRVAWGGWLAQVDHQTDLIPELLRQVNAYRSSGERDYHDALLSVIGALIELRATVPAEDAAKLYPEFAAQSVILLVRSQGAANRAFFVDILDRAGTNATWLAAGNALLKQDSPGFAARLLDRFTQHMTISVVDSGGAGGAVGGSSECGFSLAAPKKGWPPVGLYLLTQYPERIPWLTTTFLIGGETPVYYWRAEPGNYDNPPDAPGRCEDGNRDRYRAQYLGKLLQGASSALDLDPYPDITIEWKDDESYRLQVAAAIAERQSQFRRVVERLRSLRKVTPDEGAELKPHIEVMVVDQRRKASEPLPLVPGGAPAVEFTREFSKPRR